MVERQEPAKTPEQFEERLPFSEGSKQIMHFAEEEARRLNHNLIGSEHLLLGLTRDPSIEGTFLAHNIGSNRIRSAVEFIVGRGEHSVAEKELARTPRFRKIIDLADNEARNESRQEITPEDLLTGTLLEGEGIAAGVLGSLGLTVERLRELKGRNLETIIKNIENQESLRIAYELDVVLKDPNVDPETKDLLTNTIRNTIELAKRARHQLNS